MDLVVDECADGLMSHCHSGWTEVAMDGCDNGGLDMVLAAEWVVVVVVLKGWT